MRRATGATLTAVLTLALPILVGAAPAAAPAPDPRAWPVAYEATAMQPKELLAGVKRAAGDLGEGKHTLRVRWSFRDGGLQGTERDVFSGDDYRIDTTSGPFVTAEGEFNGQRWETNENGYTLLKRGIHKRAEANARALEQLDPADNVKLLGRLHSPKDVFALRVAPADGRPEIRFYDATTFHLVRRETQYLGKTVVTTYDDFRAAKGVTMAYRTTFSDGHPENDAVWTIEDLKADDPVLPAELDIPGSRRLPVSLPEGVDQVRLPARVDNYGHVIVRLTVKGRGLDFQLDSGAAGVVLDREVARELNIPVIGRWSNTVAGTFTTGRAIIPKVEIGTVTIDDLIVDALPFAEDTDARTRVVGLLGFDFIAGCVVKIDYEHGDVYAIRSSTFTPPPNGVVLDAILDDEVPLIKLSVNGTIGDRFVLDTGADDVVFFSGFAARHPDAVDDHSPKKILSRLFPVVQAGGVGGRLSIRPVLIAQMMFGNVRFRDYLAFVMAGAQPSFEGEDLDGLIGSPTLRAFDVYLDYAESRVVLVPNGRTKRTGPAKPAG